jgi:glycosyltransferase involved in cell wall biosynthesis
VLLANFAPDAQQSMLRMADLLHRELTARGHRVESIAPTPRLARLCRNYRYAGWPKLLGYADKFVLFPRILRRFVAAHPGAVFHIVDHANAVYLPHLPRQSLVNCNDLLQIRSALGEIPQNPISRTGRRYQQWILRNLSQAPVAACISGKTRDDLRRLTNLPAERTPVIHLGLSHPYRRIEQATATARLAAAGIPLTPDTPFLLNVGGGQWYKNRPGLLRIFHALRTQHGYTGQLAIVGKPLGASDTALAQSLGLPPHLVSPPPPSNDTLEALYSLADGLIFPSWEEGFGWPNLEALACGCRVFTSNRPPMTEIGGEAAVYFDPGDPVAAATAIASALRQTPSYNAAGISQAARFSVGAMIEGYRALYDKLRAT